MKGVVRFIAILLTISVVSVTAELVPIKSLSYLHMRIQ